MKLIFRILAVLNCLLIFADVGRAALPDVLVDTKSEDTSPCTLRQIVELGNKNYKATGSTAAANLTTNKDLSATLGSESAASTKGISALTLKRIAAIESKCDLDLAYSKPKVKGYFQMSSDACTDVGIQFADIDDKAEWKKGCEAGRKFLDLNWQRIDKQGIPLVDGDQATLTALYLWHQQGSGGAAALLKHLSDGSAAKTVANDNMRNNIGPKALAMIDGPDDVDHELTELEYYAFWVGAIKATIESIK